MYGPTDQIPLSARDSRYYFSLRGKNHEKEKEKKVQEIAEQTLPILINKSRSDSTANEEDDLLGQSLPLLPSSFPPHGFKSGSAITFSSSPKRDQVEGAKENEKKEKKERLHSLKNLAISDEGTPAKIFSSREDKRSLAFPIDAFSEITFNAPFPSASGIKLRKKRSTSLSPRDLALQKYKLLGLQKGKIRKIESDIAKESVYWENKQELFPFYVTLNTMVEHYVWEQIKGNIQSKKEDFLEKEVTIEYYNFDRLVEHYHTIIEEERRNAVNWHDSLVNQGIIVSCIKKRLEFFIDKIDEGLKKEQEKEEIESLLEEEIEGIRNFLKTIIHSKHVQYKQFLVFLKEKGRDRKYGFLMWTMLGGDPTELFNLQKRLTIPLLRDFVKAWLWVELSIDSLIMFGKKEWDEKNITKSGKKQEKGEKEIEKKEKKRSSINQIGSNKISRSLWGTDTACPLLNLIVQNHPIQVPLEQVKEDPLIQDSVNPRFVIERKNYLKNFLRALAESGFKFESFNSEDESQLDIQALMFLSGLNIEGNKILRGVSLEALALSARQVVKENYRKIFSSEEESSKKGESSKKFEFHTHDIHPQTTHCIIEIHNPTHFKINREISYESRLKRNGKDDSATEISLIELKFMWQFSSKLSKKNHEPQWRGQFTLQNIVHKEKAPLLALYNLFIAMDPKFAQLSDPRTPRKN